MSLSKSQGIGHFHDHCIANDVRVESRILMIALSAASISAIRAAWRLQKG